MLVLSISARADVVALLVVTAGCASAGPGAQGSYQQDHVTVDAPGGRFDLLLTRERYLSSDTLTIAPSRAWPALVQTYASFGVPIQGADAARHVIATQYVHALATFAGERMSRMARVRLDADWRHCQRVRDHAPFRHHVGHVDGWPIDRAHSTDRDRHRPR